MAILRGIVARIHRWRDPIGHARSIGVTVGKECRFIRVSFSSEPYLVTIGDHVSATNTHFETHDGGVWVLRREHPDIDIVKPIRVGNNVYFGRGVTVLPGVTIGDNCVIGAGAVVTKDIPSNSVAVGVPARVIRQVPDYAAKSLEIGHPTKRMSSSEKRTYYEQLYDSTSKRHHTEQGA